MSKGQVVALGGGGFSMEPDNPLLDDFVLSRSRRRPARVCFVSTASAESPAYIAKFYRAFSGRCIPTDLTLFDSPSLSRHPPRTKDLASFIASQDIIYVGGGSTANLLAVWRMHGLDRLLRRAWLAGAVMSGISAGMICWFQGGITDSFGGFQPLRDGLGFIRATACPHYDGEPERQEAFRKFVAQGAPAGYAAEDGVALHFVGHTLKQAVGSRPNAAAYQIKRRRGEVLEIPISVRYLG